MTSSTTPAAARKYFDAAMALLDSDVAGAAARFREATEVDPSMADAWLGRIAVGDEALSTIEQLYNYGSRLHRETNRIGARLSAPIKAGPVSVDFGDRGLACRPGTGERSHRRTPVRESRSAACGFDAAGHLGKPPVEAVRRVPI